MDVLKRITVICDVYKCGVVFLIGSPEAMIASQKDVGVPLPEIDEAFFGGADGMLITRVNDPDRVVWLRRWSIPCLVHEAVHAAKSMLTQKGVDDEESLCYLVEHIVHTALTARRNGDMKVVE